MTTRCKVYVESVKQLGVEPNAQEEVQFRAVGGNKVQKGYPADGMDEDNTYAKFSPSADFRLTIANPALLGKFKNGDKFYVDFSPAEA